MVTGKKSKNKTDELHAIFPCQEHLVHSRMVSSKTSGLSKNLKLQKKIRPSSQI